MAMLTKEDAEKALELYAHLDRLWGSLEEFINAKHYKLSVLDSFTSSIPIASDIARQIAYKYLNDKSYDIVQQLKEMGFEYNETGTKAKNSV